jgi:hypothetical protein
MNRSSFDFCKCMALKALLAGFALIAASPSLGWAQGVPPIQFRPEPLGPAVRVAGRLLAHPWVGGMACPQFHSLDLDGDGIEERLVFDRVDQSLMIYQRSGAGPSYSWTPAPRFLPLFPRLDSWVECGDFDGDGHKDLFTSNNGGVTVYRNNGTGQSPRFSLRVASLQAMMQFGFRSGIYVNSIDRPGLADLDGDGDLDFLAFDFFEIGKINFFRNYSRERFGHSDSLDFVQESLCWGRFVENQFNTQVILGLDSLCQLPAPLPLPLTRPDQPLTLPGLPLTTHPGSLTGRPMHLGSTINLVNPNRDSLYDLLLGDVEGTFLTYMQNGGTRSLARMVSQTTQPLFWDTTVSMAKFPAAYRLPASGLVGDPVQDLVVAPNEFFGSNLQKHVWHYKNLGGSAPGSVDSFRLSSRSFMLEDMVHHHLKAAPVLADLNGDNRVDLLVAYQNSALKPCLALYLNNGSSTQPLFELADSLFLRLDTLPIWNPRPAAGDLDGDGRKDLLIGHGDSTLIYYRNLPSTPGSMPGFQLLSFDYQGLRSGTELAPELGDLNGDGRDELLVGMRNGQVACFVNQGTTTVPVWTKFSDSLGGIRVAESVSGFAAPRVADFNRDGQPDLLVGSESGKVYGFPSLWLHLSAPLTQNNLFCYNSNGGVSDSLPHGNFIVPASGDLDGDLYPDLLLGFFKGGLVHWRNRSLAASVAELKPQGSGSDLRIRPHPVRRGQSFEVAVDEGVDYRFIVYDAWGRRVWRADFQGGQGWLRLDTKGASSEQGLESGSYVLIAHKKNGPPKAARFLIVD